MPDRFKKTQAGQPLDISAEVWNSFIDTVRGQKGKKHDQLAEALDQIRQGDIIKVRNNTDADRLRFHVLGIDSPIISPSEHLREFKNQVAIEGVKPKHPKHFTRFAILLDPLRIGKIGRAWVSGVCPAYVIVEDECHEYADVKHCDPTALISRPAGSAKTLWREGGLGGQWAIVRLSNYPDDIRRFKLTAPLDRCGFASAVRVIYDGSNSDPPCPTPMPDKLRWCETDCPFTVYDSLGIVCADLCHSQSSSASGECCCKPTSGVPAGTYGWAKWMADSGKWEVMHLGEGCCDSSSGSSSSGSSASSSSSSGLSSGSSGSSSGSSSGPASGVVIYETDVRCENDKLNVYTRAVTLKMVGGVLSKEVGLWMLDHQAGCCCCDCCSSSSGSSSSSSSSGSSGSSSSSCPTTTVEIQATVPAKACIWFAWAEDDAVGPGGAAEQPMADYRPVPLNVPAGALSVSLSATGQWTNLPSGPFYGPEGRNKIKPLLNPDYRSATYHNLSITGIATNLAQLIAIWQIGPASPGNPPTTSVNEFAIGDSLANLPVPAGATKLLLAAHDSRNWTDNRGSVNVTATWTVEDCE